MVYFTGDIHGNSTDVIDFCETNNLSKNDVIVLLGDVGANYSGSWHDKFLKKGLSCLRPTIFCIHGNHEQRPNNIPTYQLKEWRGGKVWYEQKYPNLLFAKDGEIFQMEGCNYLVIGGAYSVDKNYRLKNGIKWWNDEQPSQEIKEFVEKQIKAKKTDVVLSHTCPYKYVPKEMFLPGIDQSDVDDSTERWLDKIEESVDYKAWFCGHWHTDKHIDKIHFLFQTFEDNTAL